VQIDSKTRKRSLLYKGVGRKIFRGPTEKKIPKNSKKARKIALFSFFQGGWQQKKRPKNSIKNRKIALLCLFQGVEANRKKSKKDRKIALLNLFQGGGGNGKKTEK